MTIHLVNPSNHCFGVGAICPRWLYVIAAATPARYGTPMIVDETIARVDITRFGPGDVVGISVHTGNALRGYDIGTQARQRGAVVIFGGVHASLFPEEAFDHGGAHAVVKGDGEIVWGEVLADVESGGLKRLYDGGRVEAEHFLTGRWELMPRNRYLFASVQTLRGCPKHCSFCSVWRTDGQRPRQRPPESVATEARHLRRLGFRFILLADDNFYPVTLGDLEAARAHGEHERLARLRQIRADRFELMRQLSRLPNDTIFFTQITMEAADDVEFLTAMRDARIKGALIGVESVTAEGLKAVRKSFNDVGDGLVGRLQQFQRYGIHVLASFIFGLSTDTPETFAMTNDVAERSGVTFAQFLMLTPFPGTVDYAHWERTTHARDAGLTRYRLTPLTRRPRVLIPHPTMSPNEIRMRTEAAWKRFYRSSALWRRTAAFRSLRGRVLFFVICRMFQRMFFTTGIATDSARISASSATVKYLARLCCRGFVARPLDDAANS